MPPDLAILALVLIWGANFSVVKAALREFDPLGFNALRFVIGSAILYAFLRAGGRRLSFTRRELPTLLALGLVGNFVYQVLFIYGLDWTLAGNAALMLATSPIFVTLLSAGIGHERISAAGWAGVVLSVAGIGLVVWGGSRTVEFGAATVRGDLTMLGAAVAWSVFTVGSAPLVRRHGPLRATAVTMWIGTVAQLVVAAPGLAAQRWSEVSVIGWSALAFSGALAIALAYIIWYYGVRHIGSSRTAVYSNTVPVVALLVAWATLGEVPTWMQVAGTTAIVGGILLARLPRPGEGRRRPAAAGPDGSAAAAGTGRAAGIPRPASGEDGPAPEPPPLPPE
ncbi:MAG: EamA family transporter [Gemmatimonadota bacterium]|nr:EamA family transporter [Gemmatimonadota bacterium]